jgi:hypothetical protein
MRKKDAHITTISHGNIVVGRKIGWAPNMLSKLFNSVTKYLEDKKYFIIYYNVLCKKHESHNM